MPASPALLKLNYDPEYRQALQSADLVLPDSELLVVLGNLVGGGKLRKISGIDYLTTLLDSEDFARGKEAFWIVRSDDAKKRASVFLKARDILAEEENFHVISSGGHAAMDHAALLAIEARRPRHVILALRAGHQEQLGIYLREYLLSHPAIHCVGSALALLSGEEQPIPDWAQKHRLGWLARLIAQPSMILPRFGIAAAFVMMVIRYRSELPPLRTRWTDL